MKYIDKFRESEPAKVLISKINELAKGMSNVHIMEVCGSHTMSIAKFGIREILPSNIDLISGPGCPVCVTPPGYIDVAIQLAKDNHIIATFGDMINVPGSQTTLSKCRTEGARIEVCYSPSMAIKLAEENPDKEIVFLAIGFETTICPVTSIVKQAIDKDIHNISLLTAFKLVPPALDALVIDSELSIDAFLCPAHVSAIIGSNAYLPYAERDKKACVVAGFEPLDILYALCGILKQIKANNFYVDNQYNRVVKPNGNKLAQKLINTYLKIEDAIWRGIGIIPNSGLNIKDEFERYDASKKFNIQISEGNEPAGCLCGDVIKGKYKPYKCALFGKSCTPSNPIGPCMVSSEGSCAAYYKYSRI